MKEKFQAPTGKEKSEVDELEALSLYELMFMAIPASTIATGGLLGLGGDKKDTLPLCP